MCPAPPVSTHTPLQLPAEAASSFWPAPTQGTLIRVRHLNHRLTTGTGYHSGRHTPCAVIPVHHNITHVGRTTMRPSLPGMSEAPAPAQSPVRHHAPLSIIRIQKR